MTKILIVNQYAGSEHHGMEFRPNYLARSLRQIDEYCNVEILCASFSHMRKQNFSFRGMYKKITVDDITYHVVKTNKYQGNGILRLFSIISFSILASIYILSRLTGFNAVILSSTHTLDFLSGFAAKLKIRTCKIIYEPHDLWPLAIIELSKKSKYHPVVMLFALGEYLTIKCSDLFISMHPGNINHLKKFGVEEKKFLHAPNGIFNVDQFDLLYQSKTNNIRKLPFVIGYTGTINAANNLSIFIEAVSKSKYKNDIVLRFVGDGDRLNDFKKLARNLDVELHAVGRLSKVDALKETSKFDIGIIGFHNVPFYRFGVSANKIWDYMGLGVPILAVYKSCNDPVSDANCGVSVNTFSVDDVRKMIDFLYMADIRLLTSYSRNGRAYVLKNNTYTVIASSIYDFITSN